MKEFLMFCILLTGLTLVANEFGVWDEFHQTAKTVHNYEYKSLELSRKLRMAEKENYDLKAEIAKLKAEKEHLAMTMKPELKREIASVRIPTKNDLVKFSVFKWSPEKLRGVGSKELHFKNYEKSAQFYTALVKEYPNYPGINDQVLYEAGVAAYESGRHYDWAKNHFKKIVQNYPDSKYYRGAKMWLALSHFYTGDEKKFMATVEEFRLKYRNTEEWKLLSRYYEELAYKYKK